MKKKTISIDVGTSYVKARKDKVKLPVMFPALASDSQLNAGLADLNESGQGEDHIFLKTPEGFRSVGSLAKHTQHGAWRIQGNAKYRHPEYYQLMLQGAFSELGGAGPVCLGLAVPGKWFNKKTVTQIQNLAMGTHTINREGRMTQKVIVTQVEILSETGALLYSKLLNPDGTEADPVLTQYDIVVVDIGEFTTCIDRFRSARHVGNTKSLTHVSMGKLHDLVVSLVEEKTGKTLKAYEVRDSILSGNCKVIIKGKPFDLKSYYKIAVTTMANLLTDEVSTVVGDQDSHDLIICGGGGSEVLGKALEVFYDRVEIAGQFGTLQGLHNFTTRRNHG